MTRKRSKGWARLRSLRGAVLTFFPHSVYPWFLAGAVGLAIGWALIGNAEHQWDFRVYLAASAALTLESDPNPYVVENLHAAAEIRGIPGYEGLPYLYQPLVARLLTPLLTVPPEWAATIWVAMKAMAYGLLFLLAGRLAGVTPSLSVGVPFVLFVVVYRGATGDFMAGNVATFELCLLGAWLAGRQREQVWLPALAMTLLVAIKPIPALLLLDEPHRREWKVLSACAGLTALALAVQAWDGSLWMYLSYLRGDAFQPYWDELQQGLYNHSVSSALHRLTCETFLTQPLLPLAGFAPLAVPLAAVGLFLGAVATFRVWEKRNGVEPRSGPAAALAITTLLVLSPRVADYTMAWTVLPVLLLTVAAVRRRNLAIGALVALGVLAIHIHVKFSKLIGAGLWQAAVDHDTYGFLLLHAAATWACLQERPVSTDEEKDIL